MLLLMGAVGWVARFQTRREREAIKVPRPIGGPQHVDHSYMYVIHAVRSQVAMGLPHSSRVSGHLPVGVAGSPKVNQVRKTSWDNDEIR